MLGRHALSNIGRMHQAVEPDRAVPLTHGESRGDGANHCGNASVADVGRRQIEVVSDDGEEGGSWRDGARGGRGQERKGVREVIISMSELH